MPMCLIKKQLLLIIFLTIAITAPASEAKKKYKMIPLQSLQFSTVKKICEPMLSPDGKLVYEQSRRSVIVYDTPEKIAKIEDFIRTADRPPVNIRIQLTRQSTAPGSNFYIGETPGKKSGYIKKYSPKVKIKGGNANIKFYSNDLKNTNHQSFRITDQKSIENRNISSFIMTASGQPASLWVGTSRVDPGWLRAVRHNPKVIIVTGSAPTVIESMPDEPQYTNIGVSLQVLPTYSDNGMIHVQIYPEISYLVGGKRKNVKVESLTASVTVRNGQRVNIGGVMSAKSSQYSELFGRNFFSRKEVAEVMNMYLTATATTPGKSIPGGSSNITDDWIPRGRIIRNR